MGYSPPRCVDELWEQSPPWSMPVRHISEGLEGRPGLEGVVDDMRFPEGILIN